VRKSEEKKKKKQLIVARAREERKKGGLLFSFFCEHFWTFEINSQQQKCRRASCDK
jgi:hypothetical protein